MSSNKYRNNTYTKKNIFRKKNRKKAFKSPTTVGEEGKGGGGDFRKIIHNTHTEFFIGQNSEEKSHIDSHKVDNKIT